MEMANHHMRTFLRFPSTAERSTKGGSVIDSAAP